MVLNVRDWGAKGDGVTLDRAAIQAALDEVGAQGGGEVYIPAGTYLTGTLEVRSGTTLRVSPGATLLGSTRIEDYSRASYRHGDQTGHHLLRIADATRVQVLGGGTIDGQGPAYWDSPDRPRDGQQPWRGYRLAWSSHDWRPSPMVDISNSTDVRIEDLTLTNSAGWALNMRLSRWVWVRGVKILNPMDGPNSDGIDIDACQDVMISDCHIENGDDSIVMFTLPDTGPCERIAISNCILSTRCAAVKFYSGCGYPFRQITVNNIVVYNSERAFAVYLAQGAALQDVIMSNVVYQGGATPPNFGERPIHIDIRSPQTVGEGSRECAPETVGSASGITLSDWIIRTRGRIIVGGQPDAPVQNLTLRNILMQVTGSQDLSAFVNPTPSTGQWNRDLPHVRTIPAHIVIHGVKGLSMDGVQVVDAAAEPLEGRHGLWLERVEGDHIEGFRCYPLAAGFSEIVRR